MEQTIDSFIQVINANPNLLEAYMIRAYTQNRVEDVQRVAEDYRRIIAWLLSLVVPEKPNKPIRAIV
jgi:hypothetical protein